MRKLTAWLGAAAILTIMPATPAFAEGTIIAHDGVCGGLLPDGSGGFTNISFLGESNTRTTKSGITTVTCHFDLDPEIIPSGNLKASGFVCYTGENFQGMTTNTRLNVSPGGRAVLSCRLKT